MIEKTSAVLYDGKSSVPQNIELCFDTEKSILFFETAGEPIHWNIQAITFTKKGSGVNLQHGHELIQNIIVHDPGFVEKIRISKKNHGHNGWYDRLISHGMKLHTTIALLIIGLIVLSYIYIIPWIGEKSVALIPEEYDTKVGKMFFDQNMLFSSTDTTRTKALNLFAKELALNNTKPIKFTVVNSETVNAFALPDGNVVVYTGILDAMKDYDELVALIGHEVSHVNNRHSMKMMCRNLSGYLFVSAILGDVNGVMATVGDNVNNLQSLSFSRTFEHQADQGSFEIVTKNKINPHGISNLFKRLDDQHMTMIPEFLSSHPMTKERINYIDKMIKTQSFEIVENPKLRTLFKAIKE